MDGGRGRRCGRGRGCGSQSNPPPPPPPDAMNVIYQCLRELTTLDADRWIRRVTKVFDGLGVAEDFKVGLATYLFDGEADHWWESVKRMRDIDALTWGEFDQIFQDKYFPESVRDRMKADFLALRQGSTTVVEYERRFTELSRYAMKFISTEANRAKRFE